MINSGDAPIARGARDPPLKALTTFARTGEQWSPMVAIVLTRGLRPAGSGIALGRTKVLQQQSAGSGGAIGARGAADHLLHYSQPSLPNFTVASLSDDLL
jgi:hypothetical protein